MAKPIIEQIEKVKAQCNGVVKNQIVNVVVLIIGAAIKDKEFLEFIKEILTTVLVNPDAPAEDRLELLVKGFIRFKAPGVAGQKQYHGRLVKCCAQKLKHIFKEKGKEGNLAVAKETFEIIKKLKAQFSQQEAPGKGTTPKPQSTGSENVPDTAIAQDTAMASGTEISHDTAENPGSTIPSVTEKSHDSQKSDDTTKASTDIPGTALPNVSEKSLDIVKSNDTENSHDTTKTVDPEKSHKIENAPGQTQQNPAKQRTLQTQRNPTSRKSPTTHKSPSTQQKLRAQKNPTTKRINQAQHYPTIQKSPSKKRKKRKKKKKKKTIT